MGRVAGGCPTLTPMRRPALMALLVLPLLGSCRYNLVPVIPRPVEFSMPARVTNAALVRDGSALVLRAGIEGQFEPGYLAVTWYDDARALGTDSVYLDASGREATFRLDAPEPGAYRATLSFGGTLLRQVELYEVQP